MLRRIISKYRRRNLGAWLRIDDHPAFADVAAGYRKRGVQIGKMARLLSTIDGVNPLLVNIGEFGDAELHSALLDHCPMRRTVLTRIIDEARFFGMDEGRSARH